MIEYSTDGDGFFVRSDENLEVLKTGCFKYFELGGECVGGPVSLLSAYVYPYLLL